MDVMYAIKRNALRFQFNCFSEMSLLLTGFITFDKISWIIKPDLFKPKVKSIILFQRGQCKFRTVGFSILFYRNFISILERLFHYKKVLLNMEPFHFLRSRSLVIWVWGTNNHMVLSNKSQYEHFPGHFSQVYEKISSQLKIW